MRLRSPLLKAYSRFQSQRDRLTFQRRTFFLACSCLIIAVPIVLVAFRLLPVDGLGKPLYAFHDSLYLPAKGHLYHRFGTFASVIWGLLSVVLLGWLLAFVQQQSLFRPLHLFLTRVLLAFPISHGLLLTSSRLLARRGFPPRLLTMVVHASRLRALDLACAANPRQRAQALALSRLQIGLLQADGQRPARDLHIALVWLELLPLRGDLPKAALAELAKQINDTIAGSPVTTDDALSMPRLLELTQLTLVLAEPKLLKTVVPDLNQASLPTDELELFIGLRLQARLSRQINQLDHFRQRLEARQFQYGGAFEHIEEHPLAGIEHAEACGRVFFALVMAQSVLWGDARFAMSLHDIYDALRLVLSLYREDGSEGIHDLVYQFLADQPERRHYQILGKYRLTQLQQEMVDWRKSGLDLGGLVLEDDYFVAKQRVHGLFQAAGPDFGRSEGP